MNERPVIVVSDKLTWSRSLAKVLTVLGIDARAPEAAEPDALIEAKEVTACVVVCATTDGLSVPNPVQGELLRGVVRSRMRAAPIVLVESEDRRGLGDLLCYCGLGIRRLSEPLCLPALLTVLAEEADRELPAQIVRVREFLLLGLPWIGDASSRLHTLCGCLIETKSGLRSVSAAPSEDLTGQMGNRIIKHAIRKLHNGYELSRVLKSEAAELWQLVTDASDRRRGHGRCEEAD